MLPNLVGKGQLKILGSRLQLINLENKTISLKD